MDLHEATSTAALLNERRGAGSLAFNSLRSPLKNSPGASKVPLANSPNISRTLAGNGYVPTVTENEGATASEPSTSTRRLLKDRIILIGRPIDDVVAKPGGRPADVPGADDPEKEIQIYVNSLAGRSAPASHLRHMQYVRAPISTVCIGRAASFGTVILMAGEKGRRFSLPSSNIHMHQH